MGRLAEAREPCRGLQGGPLTRRQIEDGWTLCEHCGKPLHPNVFRHASKRCPGYSALWAMDVYVIFGENVHEYGGRAALFTVTPPGVEFLPWDEKHCQHLGEHKHNGKLGCRVDPKMAAVWNESAQARFTAAQREAKRRADRKLRRHGWRGENVSKLLSWWEPQRRGVLHAHVLLPMATPAERFWSRAYIAAWFDVRERFWFGNVDRRPKADAAEKLARYCAGYTLGGGEKMALEEAVRSLDWMPTRTFHVNRRLTQRTGATMRAARFNRRFAACIEGRCAWPARTRVEWEAAIRFRLRALLRTYGAEACSWLLREQMELIPPEACVP